jgi:hypothetical protein
MVGMSEGDNLHPCDDHHHDGDGRCDREGMIVEDNRTRQEESLSAVQNVKPVMSAERKHCLQGGSLISYTLHRHLLGYVRYEDLVPARSTLRRSTTRED